MNEKQLINCGHSNVVLGNISFRRTVYEATTSPGDSLKSDMEETGHECRFERLALKIQYSSVTSVELRDAAGSHIL